jgi:hypothetical protein
VAQNSARELRQIERAVRETTFALVTTKPRIWLPVCCATNVSPPTLRPASLPSPVTVIS